MIDQMFEYLSYPIALIALIGAYFNSNFKVEGFYLWIISNIFFVLFNVYYGHYGMTLLYICYLGTSVNGIYKNKLLIVK